MYDEDDNDHSKIMLCYGGAVGEGGYGGYGGYVRRVRLFDIDTQSGTIQTYKYRRNEADAFDRQTLVANGVPVEIS
jgi:3',5'-cyclic AMP phosphodiesterase CpdA